MKDVLTRCDSTAFMCIPGSKSNVFFHSACSGDRNAVNLALDIYEEESIDLKDCYNMTHVNNRVYDLIVDGVLDGDLENSKRLGNSNIV